MLTNQVSWISTSSKKADISVYSLGLNIGWDEGAPFDRVPEKHIITHSTWKCGTDCQVECDRLTLHLIITENFALHHT